MLIFTTILIKYCSDMLANNIQYIILLGIIFIN